MNKGVNPFLTAKNGAQAHVVARNNKHVALSEEVALYALQYAMRNLRADKDMHNKMMNLIRDNSVDPNFKNSAGYSPFLYQCSGGSINNIKELIEKFDINYNQNENDGWNCLTFAAVKGRLDLVNYLLNLPQIDVGMAAAKAAAADQADTASVIEAFQSVREVAAKRMSGAGEPVADINEQEEVPVVTKVEEVKPEPVKVEEIKSEPVKVEPVKTEPVKAEPIKKTKKAEKKAEPVKTEPVKKTKKAEPTKKTESVKTEPVKKAKKAEPVKTEPVKKTEAKKTEPVKAAEPQPAKKGIFGWLFGK